MLHFAAMAAMIVGHSFFFVCLLSPFRYVGGGLGEGHSGGEGGAFV